MYLLLHHQTVDILAFQAVFHFELNIYTGWAKLHAFSCTLSQRDTKTRDDQEGTSLLELGDGCTKVVNIINVNQEGLNQQIFVVGH